MIFAPASAMAAHDLGSSSFVFSRPRTASSYIGVSAHPDGSMRGIAPHFLEVSRFESRRAASPKSAAGPVQSDRGRSREGRPQPSSRVRNIMSMKATPSPWGTTVARRVPSPFGPTR